MVPGNPGNPWEPSEISATTEQPFWWKNNMKTGFTLEDFVVFCRSMGICMNMCYLAKMIKVDDAFTGRVVYPSMKLEAIKQ